MTQSTAEQMRAWRGPAILSFGFRPLFLLAWAWAAIAMVIWICMLAGAVTLPSAFDPVTWHAHEFLFGYVGAVIAGFLLTAVPNWTGRLPVVGWALAGLCGLWIAGRIVIAVSATLPPAFVIAVDLSFLAVLWAMIAREIIAGKNWRNLPVLVLVGLFIVANLVFHLSPGAYGMRAGLAVTLVLITLIGGKVTPSFTRNWLVKQGATKLPSPPMQPFDKLVIGVTILAMLGWVIWPDAAATAAAMVAVAILHVLRLTRWEGIKTGAEPLLWVMHIAYGFVPLGAGVMAVTILRPALISHAAALHVWTVGAIGLMTVAVTTRAALGHTGQALHAGRAMAACYAALILSVATRIMADLLPSARLLLLDITGVLWIAAFGLLVVIFAPALCRPRQ